MLFADDMVIFGKSPQELQNSLNLLHTYCLKWGLEVNTAKTKIMVFRKRGPLSNDEQWSYDNNKLEMLITLIILEQCLTIRVPLY